MTVVVVDDSILMRNILKDFFENRGIQVVAEAPNGQKAVELVQQLQPDFATMDVDMPIMNGIEATAEIMKQCPVPIVVFSGEVTDEVSFAAFKAGAADVIEKPELDQFYDPDFTEALAQRFQAVTIPQGREQKPVPRPRDVGTSSMGTARVDAVVLGASTGGPVAVKSVLSVLPADFPVGIAVVQHIEARFSEGYAKWLDAECALAVRIARENDRFSAGTVIVAPGDRHLVVSGDILKLDDGPKVGSHRPAVDRLFESAADAYREHLVGVLLTGMGRDGAAGCVRIRTNGGYTIVQDQDSSFIYGMPKAAAEMGGASTILPLTEIPATLLEVTRRG